jgi:hypothetical protein
MEDIKKEEAEKISEVIQQAQELEKLEEMIKNNIIEFTCDDIKYRVRKPNYAERQEIRNVKISKHNELRNNPAWKYEVQLVTELEAKGISIASLVNKMLEKKCQIEELQIKLAEFGDQKEEDNKIISDLKGQIYNLLVEQRSIALEKAEYLSESIEAELLSLVNSYTCYIGLDKEDNGKWVRAFPDYDTFMNSDKDVLMYRAGYYMSLLIYAQKDESK